MKHFHENELDKACFTHDAAYSDSKDLTKRTISDKILKDRANEIARNRGYGGYRRVLASMIDKFFVKRTGSAVSVNEHLAEELHKPLTEKFKRIKVYTRFKTMFRQQI